MPTGAAILVAALLAGAASGAGEGLPASPCAALPDKGPVAATPTDLLPAEPTAARGWRCPDDYNLDLTGRRPLCRGGIASVPGNPRAACLAALAFGPLAPLPPRRRPTASCPTRALTTVLALRGPGLGWRETEVTVAPAGAVTIATLADPAAAAAANPVVRGCFAPDCRLIRLTIGPAAGSDVTFTARLSDAPPVTGRLTLTPFCPVVGAGPPTRTPGPKP